MWLVMASDFVLLNAILLVYMRYFEELQVSNRQFIIVNNIALLISEWKFHARIHERFATAGEVLRRLSAVGIRHDETRDVLDGDWRISLDNRHGILRVAADIATDIAKHHQAGATDGTELKVRDNGGRRRGTTEDSGFADKRSNDGI